VNKIRIEEQHGFRLVISTTTYNLVLTNFVFDSFKKLSQVGVIYTDLAKAFDTVYHKILLKFLKASGFCDLLSFFCSFLSNSQQLVKLFGTKSKNFFATSGVSQGGNLSPMLFSLIFNSVCTALLFCKLLCFTYDFKLYMEINFLNDCVNLQYSIDCFDIWCSKIGLKTNAANCHVKTFTRFRTATLNDYYISSI